MNKLLFLLIIFSGSAQACGEYFYGRIAYGVTINNLDIVEFRGGYTSYDSATLEFGYTRKISDQWHWDLQFQHKSHYFIGSPFNNKPELTSESINLGLEYRSH